jgi:hypothetical protein
MVIWAWRDVTLLRQARLARGMIYLPEGNAAEAVATAAVQFSIPTHYQAAIPTRIAAET